MLEQYEQNSKLALTDSERQYITARAEELCKGFDTLDSINTDGIKPLVTVLDCYNILREDVAIKVISKDTLLSNAPEQYDGYFQVPKTLD